VISEETGTLSLAQEGRISRGLTEEELKVTLLGLIGPQARVAPFHVPALHVPMPVRMPELLQWARRRSE
jgi:hypothetical protein